MKRKVELQDAWAQFCESIGTRCEYEDRDGLRCCNARDGLSKFCAPHRQDACPIHDEVMQETHPADVENGPSPDDVYNRLECLSCTNEDVKAVEESVCLAHRLPLGECMPCLYRDPESEFDRGWQEGRRDKDQGLSFEALGVSEYVQGYHYGYHYKGAR